MRSSVPQLCKRSVDMCTFDLSFLAPGGRRLLPRRRRSIPTRPPMERAPVEAAPTPPPPPPHRISCKPTLAGALEHAARSRTFLYHSLLMPDVARKVSEFLHYRPSGRSFLPEDTGLPAVVLDCGSDTMKVGYGGDEEPCTQLLVVSGSDRVT